MLNNQKAKDLLGWKPAYSADIAIEKTVSWYKKYYNSENMLYYSIEQIKEYMEKQGL